MIKTINIIITLIVFAFIAGCKSYEEITPLNIQSKQVPEERTFKNLFNPNKEYQYFENTDNYPFRYKSDTFELVNAWWLAEASMLVYVEEEDSGDVFTFR